MKSNNDIEVIYTQKNTVWFVSALYKDGTTQIATARGPSVEHCRAVLSILLDEEFGIGQYHVWAESIYYE